MSDVHLKPPKEPIELAQPQLWTCGCNAQLWRLTEEGRAICSGCGRTSSALRLDIGGNQRLMASRVDDL